MFQKFGHLYIRSGAFIFCEDSALYRTPWIDFLRASPKIGLREANMIKKVKAGYKVTSEKGKNLGGPYKSKAAAQKRLRQVEYFKHRKG